MNELLIKKTLEIMAEEGVPSDLDGWSKIQTRFFMNPPHETSKHPSIMCGDAKKDPKMIRHRNLKFYFISLLIPLLIIAGLLVAFQGQAWAQSLLRYFNRAGNDTLPVQSWQLTPLPAAGISTPDPASILDVHQTVDEVEQLAGYKVLQPAWLPDVLSLVGASYQPDHRIVRIFYRYIETNGLVFTQEPFQTTDDCHLCGAVGASASVETVQIGLVSGEYVEGVWNLTDKGPVWENNPFLKKMRWQENSVAFEILYMGPPDSVTKDDLIAIAQSIK